MIKTYLFELLKVNSRVIIPDFGAFLVKEKPDGKMEVSFNDFLKFNDGLLANKIIKTENITKIEATKKIKEFIKEVEDRIKTGERFVIEKVGEIHKDDFGRIKFDPYKEGEDQKAEQVAEKRVEKIEEKKEEEKEKDNAKEEVKDKSKDEVNVEKKKIVSAEKKKETSDETKPEGKKETVPADSSPAGQTEKEDFKLSEQIAAKVVKEPVKKKAMPAGRQEVVADIIDDSEMITAKPKQAKSSATLIWVSGIVVIIAAIITWGVIDYDRIKGWFSSNEKAVVETPVEEVIHEETVVEETPVLEEEHASQEVVVEEETETVAEEEVEEPISEPVYDGPKYYVIAGSFKVENNAINYHKRLVNDGYNSENLGFIKGFYMVSFDGFNSLQDAIKMLKMVKADQADAWVMKY